jgi:glycosyltransferase involved in cell wall biosynthesis
MVDVSIVIPTYNQAKYIRDSIDSALNQTYKNTEVIVVDDGSTDDTGEILRSYGNTIIHIHQENKGVTAAMNAGAMKAKGEFILFLSSDDILMPNIIERQLNILRNKRDVDFVYTDYYYMKDKSEIIEIIKCPFFENYNKRILWMFRYCYFMHDSVLFRRILLEKVGFWDEDMPYAGEYWMWFKCLKISNVAHISTPLVKYRIHGSQLTTHTEQIREYRKEVIKRARKLYGIGWSIKSRIFASTIFGIYWLIVGLIFKDKKHGIYWAKHILPLGEQSLDTYVFIKGKNEEIDNKFGKENLRISEKLWYYIFRSIKNIREIISKMNPTE